MILIYLANGVEVHDTTVKRFFRITPKISLEEQENRILSKRLKDAELERDILKKAVHIYR